MKTCSLLGPWAHPSPRQASARLKGIKKASEPKFKHEPVGKWTLWKGILSKGLKAKLALKSPQLYTEETSGEHLLVCVRELQGAATPVTQELGAREEGQSGAKASIQGLLRDLEHKHEDT